jgi:Raf kinase inhibitor-like YbhB/YbcL family protein
MKLVSAVTAIVLGSGLLMAEGFTLSSNTVAGQLGIDQVYQGFGCTGNNISPDLNWKNAPEGTKSFALTVYDPDAPTGSGWWHWVVFNIPSKTTALSVGASLKKMPEGTVESMTDYGTSGFGGACPPKGHGAHRYVFTLHALDVEKLDLDDSANPSLAGFNINAHTIARTTLVAYYER